MLTFFPKPYPDELLYSIIARYHVWSGNYEMSDTMEELFDNRREGATLLVPEHLNCLANKTKELGLSFETLLYEHTIFPFVTCFLDKDSYDNIVFSYTNKNKKEKYINIYNHDIYPKFLKYCTKCVKEDRDEYGEAYWHRRHQYYGIEMCNKHKCRLNESDIEVIDNRYKKRYIALNLLNYIDDTQEQEDMSECSIEMQIANDIDYIFKNYEFVNNVIKEKYTSIRGITIALLFRQGLASKNGIIKNSKLLQEFRDRYAHSELKQLKKGLDGNDNWLIKICRGHHTRVDPIRFILYADFMASSLESFIKIISEQEPFINREKWVFKQRDRFEDKLIIYRKRCSDVWEKNPYMGRHYLARVDYAAYKWILRYDKEWYLDNSPQKMKSNNRAITSKHWAIIDNELECMIVDIVYYIKNLVGKPVKITKACISSYIGQNRMVERNYKSLPRTKYKIEQYVESTYDYHLRKIAWAKSELKKEGKSATPSRIFIKAGIRSDLRNQFRHLFTS